MQVTKRSVGLHEGTAMERTDGHGGFPTVFVHARSGFLARDLGMQYKRDEGTVLARRPRWLSCRAS